MRALPLIAAFGLASCQPAAVTRPADSDAFARELAGRVAGAPQACVTVMPGQGLRVVDSRTLAYGFGSTVYVNRQQSECRAFSPHNSLIVETQSGQYCRGDRIRGLEVGATIPGLACVLNEWVPYRRQ